MAAVVNMTTGDKILKDIEDKKTELMKLASKYISLQKNGEALNQKKDNTIIVLAAQINVLTRFYNNNFDANGNIEPLYVCPSVTLIRRYIDPNYIPTTSSEIIINGIDGNA